MREILFRGKRKDNGEWVEGYYHCVSSCLTSKPDRTRIALPELKNRHYIDTFKKLDNGEIVLTGNFEVIPSTVGQYTSLTDRNGKKIFEGDILKFKSGNYVVEWCNERAKFLQRGKEFNREFYDILIKKSEVIGNIYDTPELLKGEENA